MKYLKVLALIVFASFLVIGCGSGGGGGSDSGDSSTVGSDSALLVGTWDLMVDDDGDAVPSGTVTLLITGSTYAVTSPDCSESGSYTANSTLFTVTVESVSGFDCGTQGEVNIIPYSVDSTTLDITVDGDTMEWNRL